MHTLRHIKSNAGYNNGSEQMLLYTHVYIATYTVTKLINKVNTKIVHACTAIL